MKPFSGAQWARNTEKVKECGSLSGAIDNHKGLDKQALMYYNNNVKRGSNHDS